MLKVKKLVSDERLIIIISSMLVVVGFLVISQMYFIYSEHRALSNGCYDKGGFPIFEKTRLTITSFDCKFDLEEN